MKKKLIVFSADAMVTEDLEYLMTLPNFKKYLSGCSMVKHVRSIYPTITYPCHTTMITGVYPEKHGIIANAPSLPAVSPRPWNWDYHARKWKTDIFTKAKEAGYTTAAVFWPVTGNHPAIDYLIDEYWKQDEQDTLRAAWKRMGSSEEMLDVVERNMKQVQIRKHPESEWFIMDAVCDILRNYNPDLLFLHPANIDAYRHQTGVFNEQVRRGVEETDEWIGRIMNILEEMGQLEQTNFVLTSDHGQIETKRIIHPNVILADAGLIRKHADGTLDDWDVWCISGGHSARIYLKDPEDQACYEKTYQLLKHMEEEGIYGIGHVFTADEVQKQYHLKEHFSFYLESDGYTSFGEHINRPLVTKYDFTDYRYGRATHGYQPEKGPQPIFVVKGPDFASNVVLENGRLIDEAPTYAKLLGVSLDDPDGTAITELLKERSHT